MSRWVLRAGGRLLGDTRRLHSLAWLRTVPGLAPRIIPIMQWSFMAAQPSKDGRLGGSPQNFYAGRHPTKRFVQGERRIPSVSNSPEGRRADGEQSTIWLTRGAIPVASLECFIVDRSTPCLRGVGVKAWSGKEDTTLLSMADCRVKQSTVSTATRYGIKPRIQGCPRGSVRIGGQSIRYHKTKQNKKHSNRYQTSE